MVELAPLRQRIETNSPRERARSRLSARDRNAPRDGGDGTPVSAARLRLFDNVDPVPILRNRIIPQTVRGSRDFTPASNDRNLFREDRSGPFEKRLKAPDRNFAVNRQYLNRSPLAQRIAESVRDAEKEGPARALAERLLKNYLPDRSPTMEFVS